MSLSNGGTPHGKRVQLEDGLQLDARVSLSGVRVSWLMPTKWKSGGLNDEVTFTPIMCTLW